MAVLKGMVKAKSSVAELMDLIKSGELDRDTSWGQVASVAYNKVDSTIAIIFTSRPKSKLAQDALEKDLWALGQLVGLQLEGFTGWDNGRLIVEV